MSSPAPAKSVDDDEPMTDTDCHAQIAPQDAPLHDRRVRRRRGRRSSSSPCGGINKNLVYYWTPTDLHAAGDKAYGATIRLGGMVAPGSIKTAAACPDSSSTSTTPRGIVHVKSTGVPPQMFRENIGVVVEGTMTRGGYFQCNRLMVSHNNEYRAPEGGHRSTRRAGEADADDRRAGLTDHDRVAEWQSAVASRQPATRNRSQRQTTHDRTFGRFLILASRPRRRRPARCIGFAAGREALRRRAEVGAALRVRASRR